MSAATHQAPGTALHPADGADRFPPGRAGLPGLLWLTWRQHRWPILVGAAVTVVLTGWMLITANNLATLAAACPAPQCGSASPAKPASYAGYQMNTVVFLPVLLAVFWGVPLLAREYEQRTLPLAWSQDLSPLRWLFGKLAILGTLAAAMGAVLAGAAIHLAHDFHDYTGMSLFEGTAFQAGGWLPLTLGLAWLAVGVAAGAVTRRTMTAIAAVGGLWVLRMIELPRLREVFATPISSLIPIDHEFGRVGRSAETVNPNDMAITSGHSSDFVTTHGQTVPKNVLMNQWCSDSVLNQTQTGKAGRGTVDPLVDCLRQHDIAGNLQKYQPASRMGAFHLIENGLNLGLLVLAVLVVYVCVRRTRTV